MTKTEKLASFKKRIQEELDGFIYREIESVILKSNLQTERITELEAEKAGYKKAAEYWKENYDRLIGRPEGGGE